MNPKPNASPSYKPISRPPISWTLSSRPTAGFVLRIVASRVQIQKAAIAVQKRRTFLKGHVKDMLILIFSSQVNKHPTWKMLENGD